MQRDMPVQAISLGTLRPAMGFSQAAAEKVQQQRDNFNTISGCFACFGCGKKDVFNPSK